MEIVKIVKIAKMTWAAGVGACTTGGNSENAENGMGCWVWAVYPK